MIRTRVPALLVAFSIALVRAEAAPEGPAPAAPEREASFVRHVRPLIARLGCASGRCHGAPRGKGGFKLSLFGAEPGLDFDALTRAAEGRLIDRVEPARSLLLLKSAGDLAHQGGALVQRGSPEHAALLSWIARGAPFAGEKEPVLVSIEVSPALATLEEGGTLRLSVTAVYSGGEREDVTGEASFRSSDAKVAAVDGGGEVRAAGCGEAGLVATYLRKSGTARIAVPQILPFPFPDLPSNGRIDEIVHTRLRKLGLPPSPDSTDSEFLRRVHLDAIGVLPTAEEARAFLSDPDPGKRGKLIDRLLSREEFADFWALKWGDLLRIKSEYPVRVWPKGVQTYHRWVRAGIAENKPYDRFARELLTASGSNFRDGPANFFRAVPSKDPQTIAETAALIFMGARIGCARCHGHPLEDWTLEDELGLAAAFARVSFKGTSEWKEEIVFFNPRGALRDPRTKEVVKPRFPGGEAFTPGPEEDPREKFADWLTSLGNPWFARNIANRIWCWLLGRGIVHEPDDLRPTNPPQDPELLDFLAKELVEHRFDLKHLYRLILGSRTYQRSAEATRWNAGDPSCFSRYRVRRLGAEQLLDAVSRVTETSEKFSSRIPEPFAFLPEGHRATQLSDGDIGCSFLEMFGRPSRDTPYEGERSDDPSLRQALYLINSEELEGKIAASPRIRRLLQGGKDDAEAIDEIYLAALSRLPSDEDRRKVMEHMGREKGARAQAMKDLVWALLNTREFLFNH